MEQRSIAASREASRDRRRGWGPAADKKIKAPVAVVWAAVLCVALFAQTYVRAERPNGIDLTSYLLSARALRDGNSPYLLPTPFPYLYPATLAFLLIPLTFVPAIVAVLVWFAMSVAAAVWSIRTIVAWARPNVRAHWLRTLGLPGVQRMMEEQELELPAFASRGAA